LSPLQLEPSSFKTVAGNKLQDQQALLLLPRALALPIPAPAAPTAAPSSPVLMLPAANSPLRLGSPRGSGGLMATSPNSPLSRSFDRVGVALLGRPACRMCWATAGTET
jgi:hypothetical protein